MGIDHLFGITPRAMSRHVFFQRPHEYCPFIDDNDKCDFDELAYFLGVVYTFIYVHKYTNNFTRLALTIICT